MELLLSLIFSYGLVIFQYWTFKAQRYSMIIPVGSKNLITEGTQNKMKAPYSSSECTRMVQLQVHINTGTRRARNTLEWCTLCKQVLHSQNTVSSFGPHNWKRCRQTGQGPKEGHEDDQRAGEPVLGGKTEGVKSFLPGERGLSGELITVFQ